MEDLAFPAILAEHYYARYLPPSCVASLRAFIEQCPSMFGRRPDDVKAIAKVVLRAAVQAPDSIDAAHIRRAHGYVHEATTLLEGLASTRRKFISHLYRDGADLAKQCYRRTHDRSFALEAIEDWSSATRRASAADDEYVLDTLCDLAEFAVQWYVESAEPQGIHIASRQLRVLPTYRASLRMRNRVDDVLRLLRTALPRPPQAF